MIKIAIAARLVKFVVSKLEFGAMPKPDWPRMIKTPTKLIIRTAMKIGMPDVKLASSSVNPTVNTSHHTIIRTTLRWCQRRQSSYNRAFANSGVTMDGCGIDA